MAKFLAALVMLCAGVLVLNVALMAQRTTMGSPATVSSGLHNWYEIHVDPDNAKNMIICGTKWDPKADAPYGFIYYSSDGGQNWTQALEDKSSTWVTEQSCAYGVHGVVYFVSDASKVIDGWPHHDLGTTRIYISQDSGKTWRVGITTGWTDSSTSVVDTMPGPNQNRLYVFFYSLYTFYHSVGQIAAATSDDQENGHRIGMLSYKARETAVDGPFSSTEMGKEHYRGAYPGPSLVLKDGSLMAFYTTKRATDTNNLEVTVEAVHANADRSALEPPVKIIDSWDDPVEANNEYCGAFYDTAAGYDAVHDKLYFVYPGRRDEVCHLFLTSSSDGGRSWSKAQPIASPDETLISEYVIPSVAINPEGVLAVMWEQERYSGCWMLAVSEDGGASLSRAQKLGSCGTEATKESPLSTANLWTVISQADAFHKEGFKAGSARIVVRNTRNGVARSLAIAVTPDGVFHPVWIDGGNGNGEIRTVAIHVTSAASLIAPGTMGLADVTDRVAILYGGDQHYDAQSGMLTVDVVIQNKSTESIHGPFKLAVPSLSKDYGYADIENAENKATGGGAVWNISTGIPGGTLGPGAISRPFPLKFRYLHHRDGKRSLTDEDFLDFNVKVFAGIQKALGGR